MPSVIEGRLPPELLRELDTTATAQRRSRNGLVAEGIRRVLGDARWRLIQEEGAKRAREAGIATDDDGESLIDSLPDE